MDVHGCSQSSFWLLGHHDIILSLTQWQDWILFLVFWATFIHVCSNTAFPFQWRSHVGRKDTAREELSRRSSKSSSYEVFIVVETPAIETIPISFQQDVQGRVASVLVNSAAHQRPRFLASGTTQSLWFASYVQMQQCMIFFLLVASPLISSQDSGNLLSNSLEMTLLCLTHQNWTETHAHSQPVTTEGMGLGQPITICLRVYLEQERVTSLWLVATSQRVGIVNKETGNEQAASRVCLDTAFILITCVFLKH